MRVHHAAMFIAAVALVLMVSGLAAGPSGPSDPIGALTGATLASAQPTQEEDEDTGGLRPGFQGSKRFQSFQGNETQQLQSTPIPQMVEPSIEEQRSAIEQHIPAATARSLDDLCIAGCFARCCGIRGCVPGCVTICVADCEAGQHQQIDKSPGQLLQRVE